MRASSTDNDIPDCLTHSRTADKNAPLVTVAPLMESHANDWLSIIFPVRSSIAAVPMPGDSMPSVLISVILSSVKVIVTVSGPLCPVTVAEYVPGLNLLTTSEVFPEA